jgi:hypothetical protein
MGFLPIQRLALIFGIIIALESNQTFEHTYRRSLCTCVYLISKRRMNKGEKHF